MTHPFDLPFRNIHLDFHTSERIPDVGADFDPEAFADTLADAHVESVCCFARCHHGWLYYRSPGFPERIHPGLRRPDLLREQIVACHARGIRVPIYTTVQWDHFTAVQHPEWLCRDEAGRPHMAEHRRLTGGFYQNLCVQNPGFRKFIFDHTREVLETFAPSDGMFFDMVVPLDCACDCCRAGMREAGLDWRQRDERLQFGTGTMRTFEAEMSAFCRGFNPGLSIYYNGNRGSYSLDAFSHLEFDVMPGYGAGGYMNFPVHIRYARTLGLPLMAQTGRFHTGWGDMHSFKHPTALRFELSQLLALGARCCIGDQLHPRGALCRRSYAVIGEAFAEVKAKEPWCRGAQALRDIGVWSPERFSPNNVGGVIPDAEDQSPSRERLTLLGAARLLDESAQPFDILGPDTPLDPYHLMILPDSIRLDDHQTARLSRWLDAGGSLIFSAESGLLRDADNFALKAFGLRDKGWSEFDPEYIRPAAAMGGLDTIDHVTYSRGRRVEADPEAETLAWTVEPYFQRDYWRFSSHKHTPSSGRKAGPAIVRKGRCIYFAHPVFTVYQVKGADWLATMVRAALDQLLPEPLIRHNGPGSLNATLNRQVAERRLILHLLHFIPERRSQELDHIREEIPLHGLSLSVRCGESVKAVRLAPQGELLPFEQAQGRVTFTLPILRGHQIVAIELSGAGH